VSAQDGEPDGDDVPWAMQLVARVERTGPPTRSAVCAAAATAVVTLLADERARPGGEWAGRIARWTEGGRIRKHCRRARGVAWQRVQELPGAGAAVDGAEVRAFLPGPVDAIPDPIRKLQLSGRELDDPGARTELDPEPGGALVVSLTPAPRLSLGKAAAAAGHAAQLAAGAMAGARRAAWAAAGFPVRVEQPGPDRWAALLAGDGATTVVVADGGFTEVAPGTVTALARWR
jgi:hypothetical protein